MHRLLRNPITPLVLCILTVVLFEVTGLDFALQDYFWSPERGWLIHFHKYAGFGLVYYTGMKYLIALACTFCIIMLFLPKKWRLGTRSQILYVLVCFALTPAVVASLKSQCDMPYPSKITRYGGTREPNSVYQAFFGQRVPGQKRYKGWPGGHASGGYGWIALAFAPFTARKRRWGLLAALAAGTFMGLCHTMDGNHFFSHNLVSLEIAWFLACLLFPLFLKAQKREFQYLADKNQEPRMNTNKHE